jgi:putative acetyltransferase
MVPAAQRQGIGTALVAAGLKAARARGGDLAVVLGDPAYYGRFGFLPAARQGLTWEHDAPPEAFMTLSLSARGGTIGPGVVRFHDAFSIFES